MEFSRIYGSNFPLDLRVGIRLAAYLSREEHKSIQNIMTTHVWIDFST